MSEKSNHCKVRVQSVRYAEPDAVTNINTVILSSMRWLFSQKDFTKRSEFLHQTYIDPIRCKFQQKLGVTHPKKLIYVGQKIFLKKKNVCNKKM